MAGRESPALPPIQHPAPPHLLPPVPPKQTASAQLFSNLDAVVTETDADVISPIRPQKKLDDDTDELDNLSEQDKSVGGFLFVARHEF